MSRVHEVQGNATCEVCGNSRDQCFEVLLGGESHIFDSFECAMDALTPKCAYCGCTFVGHGVHLGNTVYCSYHCANDHSIHEYETRVMMNEQAHF